MYPLQSGSSRRLFLALAIGACLGSNGCERGGCLPPNAGDGISDFSESATETEVVFRFRSDSPDSSDYKVAAFAIFESPGGGPIVDVRDAVPTEDGVFEAAFQRCDLPYANAWAVVQECGAGYVTLTDWQPIQAPTLPDRLLVRVDSLDYQVSGESILFSFRASCWLQEDLAVALLSAVGDGDQDVRLMVDAKPTGQLGEFTATIPLQQLPTCPPVAWGVLFRDEALSGSRARPLATMDFAGPLFEPRAILQSASKEIVDGILHFHVSEVCPTGKSYFVLLQKWGNGEWALAQVALQMRAVEPAGTYTAEIPLDEVLDAVESWAVAEPVPDLPGEYTVRFGAWPFARE